jgi:hypothetical protein
MSDLARRARGLPVAVAVLVISASVAFAGGPGSMPEASADGLAVAAEAADKVVPVGPSAEEAVEEPAEELEPTAEEPAEEEPADEERPDNHGATVSEAAQMETPEGFVNHGAFVSCVARMAHGEDAPAIDLTTITPESCTLDEDDGEEAEEDDAAAPSKAERGKAAERGKSAERGRGAERSAAARAGRG